MLRCCLSICPSICLSFCPSVHPSDYPTICFHAITQKVLQLSTSNMVPISFGIVSLIFKVTEVKKIKFGFLSITSIRAINVKLGTNTHCG